MSKIRVLIVDDEEQFRATTKKILDKRGFDTLLAATGEEAVEKVNEKPDVVILDIKMPGIDGLQALDRIKKKAAHLPVIMLTGHGSESSAVQALEQGAYDYLSKPCEIDLLAGKILEAHERGGAKSEPTEERQAGDVMVPLEEYTIIGMEATIKEALHALKRSFASKAATGKIMETGHRSVLVFDEKNKLRGILTIVGLLRAIMPSYLSAPKPSTADTIQYSPMFWRGMFRRQVNELGAKKIKEIMSPAPVTIDAGSNLMEVAYTMLHDQVRRLAVTKNGQVLGIIREQDLFFEMERTVGR